MSYLQSIFFLCLQVRIKELIAFSKRWCIIWIPAYAILSQKDDYVSKLFNIQETVGLRLLIEVKGSNLSQDK